MSEKIVERKDKLKLLLLSDIIVGERFRKDFGDMEEFVASIQEKGIIQPVSVDSNMNLLAGGRRYEGATIAGLKHIPAIIRTFVDEIDSREIELIENVYRKDFTWHERALITAEIDALYKKNNRDWSARKTAKLLDKNAMNISRDLNLARALEYFPELATSCVTADEAIKVIKKMEADALVDELHSRAKARNETPAPVGENAVDRLCRGLREAFKIADENYQIGDCFTGMASLRTNGHVGFIECDPPYGIDLNNQKASKVSQTAPIHGYEEIPAENYLSFLDKLATETFRVAGKDCWMVFWYGATWHSQVLNALRIAGWLVDDIPAIWVKATGQTLQPEIHLGRSYEPFFICRKGKPVLVKHGHRNVFEYAGVAGNGKNSKYHPTQRPIELITDILETFTVPSQHVLIPFLGSGATLRACYVTGNKGFGWDLDGKYKKPFLNHVESDTAALFNGETPNN